MTSAITSATGTTSASLATLPFQQGSTTLQALVTCPFQQGPVTDTTTILPPITANTATAVIYDVSSGDGDDTTAAAKPGASDPVFNHDPSTKPLPPPDCLTNSSSADQVNHITKTMTSATGNNMLAATSMEKVCPR